MTVLPCLSQMRASSVRVFGGLLLLSLISACSEMKKSESELNDETPKNIILVIGDGMGPQQIGLLLSYAKQAPNSVLADKSVSFERMLAEGADLGISTTFPHRALVVDSAASASQLASGKLSGSEMIGLNHQGYSVPSLLEQAKTKGKSLGLISDTRLTHATPASFAAHQAHRSLENEIAVEMLELGPDLMLAGGLRHWIPQNANQEGGKQYQATKGLVGEGISLKSKRKDDRNLLVEAQDKGYDLAFNRKQLQKAETKVLGLFSSSAMANGIVNSRAKEKANRGEPSLKDMVQKALELLSKNKRGFVLMVEAGQIDWAGHDNDTGTMLHEMLKLNDTLELILDWQEKNTDTLLVVTADHETGGFGFSYTANDLPQGVDLPGDAFSERQYQPKFNFGKPEVLDRIYQQSISYADLFYKEFESLPKEQQTPKQLMHLVNEYTQFPITEEQAERILQDEDNPFYTEGHPYLGKKRVPRYEDNEAFFVYQNRLNLLAMAVSQEQTVAWSTGTHTSTPVLVFSLGPGQERFSQVLHHSDIGAQLQDLLE